MNMTLCLCTPLVLVGLLGMSYAEMDWGNNPEDEALNYVFGPEEDKHTGPERLRWHTDHLKEANRILTILNFVKKMHEDKLYMGYMKSSEDTWKMNDIILDITSWASTSDIKHDLYVGDAYLFPKIAAHTDRKDFTDWLNFYRNKWGNDFFKYIVMSDDFDYNITDPEQFVDAVYTIRDPRQLAEKIGMTMYQLRVLGEAFEKAILYSPEYWEGPFLIAEIAKQMCDLELTECYPPLDSIFGLKTLKAPVLRDVNNN